MSAIRKVFLQLERASIVLNFYLFIQTLDHDGIGCMPVQHQ